jgi:hypothetical protein
LWPDLFASAGGEPAAEQALGITALMGDGEVLRTTPVTFSLCGHRGDINSHRRHRPAGVRCAANPTGEAVLMDLLGIDRSADTLEKIGSDVSRHDF